MTGMLTTLFSVEEVPDFPGLGGFTLGTGDGVGGLEIAVGLGGKGQLAGTSRPFPWGTVRLLP